MIVKELIDLLSTMPQDALVIRTFCSDYDAVEEEHISLISPDEKGGIVEHHGHIMHVQHNWLPTVEWAESVESLNKGYQKVPLPEGPPKFITAVHFSGN